MRPRIDLDGVALVDADKPGGNVLAVFRLRTSQGLLLLMPESGEMLVPWSAVAGAELDLAAGLLRVRLVREYAEREAWARGAERLVGRWLDRVTL
jgi:hypothetical protein